MSQSPPLPSTTSAKCRQPSRFTDTQLRLAFWTTELVAMGCIAFIPQFYDRRYFPGQLPPSLGVIAYWVAFQFSVILLIVLGSTFYATKRLRVHAFFSILSGVVGWLIYFFITND
jgi:hypothetical protein